MRLYIYQTCTESIILPNLYIYSFLLQYADFCTFKKMKDLYDNSKTW